MAETQAEEKWEMSVFIPAVFFSGIACLRYVFFLHGLAFAFLDSIYGYAYAHD
jgi:hypothetical protein